jgi:hypothetical protein
MGDYPDALMIFLCGDVEGKMEEFPRLDILASELLRLTLFALSLDLFEVVVYPVREPSNRVNVILNNLVMSFDDS